MRHCLKAINKCLQINFSLCPLSNFLYKTKISFCNFVDYSNGGYSQDNDEELLDFEQSLNVIPTEDPFKHLTNFKRLEPYFDPNVNQNVTALVGKSAYLNCIVKNLGNKTVE